MDLESLRKQLADLELSITQQRLVLRRLEERKAAVQSAINDFTPVFTLPLEITAEIFLQFAVDVHEPFDVPFCSPYDWLSRKILVLLMVCRAWKAVALSLPALWATLNVGSLPARRTRPGGMEQLVDTWFGRAGSLPLSLSWLGGWGEMNLQRNAVLSRYAPRLRVLRLKICTGFSRDDVVPVSHTDRLSFPLLRSLYIEFRGDSTSPSLTTLVFAFEEAPQLRHVRLDRVLPSSLALPCEKLESFIACDIPPQECLDVLRTAPTLCTFEFYGSDDDPYDDQPIISHGRLTSFDLNNGNLEMIRYLALPNLEELLLANVARLDEGLFLPFLSRTCGSLRKFCFSHFNGGPAFLPIQCFGHMRHLTSLDLPYIQPTSRLDFVWALNREYEQDFLPALENLTLQDWTPDEVDTQLLDALITRCSMVEAHSEDGHVQLKTFQLLWTPYTRVITPPDVPSLIERHHVALDELERCGMEIHIEVKETKYPWS